MYWRRGGGGGVRQDPSSSQGPPMVPAECGPKIMNFESSGHLRRRRKILAVSLKHWKGRREGGSRGGGGATVVSRSNASLGSWHHVTTAAL